MPRGRRRSCARDELPTATTEILSDCTSWQIPRTEILSRGSFVDRDRVRVVRARHSRVNVKQKRSNGFSGLLFRSGLLLGLQSPRGEVDRYHTRIAARERFRWRGERVWTQRSRGARGCSEKAERSRERVRHVGYVVRIYLKEEEAGSGTARIAVDHRVDWLRSPQRAEIALR